MVQNSKQSYNYHNSVFELYIWDNWCLSNSQIQKWIDSDLVVLLKAVLGVQMRLVCTPKADGVEEKAQSRSRSGFPPTFPLPFPFPDIAGSVARRLEGGGVSSTSEFELELRSHGWKPSKI